MATQRSRNAAGSAAAAVLLAGCAASAPAPMAPGLIADPRGAMQLRCGEESFRVVFEEARAVVIEGESETVLPRLQGAPLDTFTNGRMTFTKSGGKETATEVTFGRGRMVPVKCYIAQT